MCVCAVSYYVIYGAWGQPSIMFSHPMATVVKGNTSSEWDNNESIWCTPASCTAHARTHARTVPADHEVKSSHSAKLRKTVPEFIFCLVFFFSFYLWNYQAFLLLSSNDPIFWLTYFQCNADVHICWMGQSALISRLWTVNQSLKYRAKVMGLWLL